MTITCFLSIIYRRNLSYKCSNRYTATCKIIAIKNPFLQIIIISGISILPVKTDIIQPIDNIVSQNLAIVCNKFHILLDFLFIIKSSLRFFMIQKPVDRAWHSLLPHPTMDLSGAFFLIKGSCGLIKTSAFFNHY